MLLKKECNAREDIGNRTKKKVERRRKVIINSARYDMELPGDRGTDVIDIQGRFDDNQSRANAVLLADGIDSKGRLLSLKLNYKSN